MEEIADFNYVVTEDGCLECLFCEKTYGPTSAVRISNGRAVFRHEADCPVLEARRIRAEMIEGAEDDWDEDDEELFEEEEDTPNMRRHFRLFRRQR